MEYTIVRGASVPFLIDEVNLYIQLGWKPQGGAAWSGSFFYQAMIKKITQAPAGAV